MKAPRLREADSVLADSPRNVLVLALGNAPIEAPNGNVLVVAPALNSWLRRWTSDDARARRRAAERLGAYLEQLEQNGVSAEGRIGDTDPLLAIADALTTFHADEIVIAADARARQGTEALALRARQRFSLPTSHAWDALPLAA
jgi:hypothetical protein